MRKSTLLLGVLGLLAARGALAQIPPGFEVVQITDDLDNNVRPRINNCGEVVYSQGVQGESFAEIFLYDNGAITRITDDTISDAFPDINDEGTIVWTRHADGFGGGHIVRLRDGVLTALGTGSAPRINGLGHVAWKLFDPTNCENRSIIFLYDGDTVQQITDDDFSNQSVAINDHDELVWTRFDFCLSPWESKVMLFADGITIELPTAGIQPGTPTINEGRQVVWHDAGGIKLWEAGITAVITDWGRGPFINSQGDILFSRWSDDTQTWQVWLYRDGAFHQLGDEFLSQMPGGLNDSGEAALWILLGERRDVGLMRRIRNGDTDLDFDVEIEDFADFPGCMTEPVGRDRLCECRFYDLDHDRDVDLRDFASFQNLFTGEDS